MESLAHTLSSAGHRLRRFPPAKWWSTRESKDIYEYEPISASGMIRVLDLYKTKKNKLECSITQVKLEDNGYEALSYEWGDSNQLFHILVRGKEQEKLGYISLTKNLFNALKDLRDSPGIPSKRFWIDQICINQEDEKERDHQVGLMADIFRNASRVITYLGPHAEDMEQERGAFELLTGVTKHFQPAIKEIEDAYPNSSPDARITPTLLPLLELPHSINPDNPYWTHLLRMVYSGWAHRVWMVQENVLCPKTCMLRGQQVLDWMSIGSIPVYFRTNLLDHNIQNNSWPSMNLKQQPKLLDVAAQLTWQMRRWYQYGEQGTSQTFQSDLGANLIELAHLGCKDPRDRVFAILGISTDTKKLGIVPNYQISEREIFIDISTRIYSLYQDFTFLENIGFLDNLSDTTMPSWAYRDAQSVDIQFDSASPHPLGKTSIRFEDRNTVLVAKGRVVDVVVIRTTLLRPYSSRSTTGEVIHSNIDIWKGLLVCLTTILVHTGTNLDTISSLFHASMTNTSWPFYDDAVETAFYFWCTYIDYANALIEADKTVLETPWFTQEVIPVLKQICKILEKQGRDVCDDPQVPITSDIRRISNDSTARLHATGRSLSITEQGRICNSSGKTREGDVVALLAGAEVPYVLRPVGDKYQFVGTIWVNGLMNGEAYNDVEPEDVDYEIRLI